MTPIEKIYFTSRIIHGDLSSAESELTGQLGPTGTWIPFIKTALMALGNLADLEGPMRFLYRDAPALAEQMKALDADLQFAKYLRNVFGGHLKETLMAKASERSEERRVGKEGGRTGRAGGTQYH